MDLRQIDSSPSSPGSKETFTHREAWKNPPQLALPPAESSPTPSAVSALHDLLHPPTPTPQTLRLLGGKPQTRETRGSATVIFCVFAAFL